MRPPLPPAETLEILQRLDHYRKWHSLEDQRVCVLCDRVITGREIEIERGPEEAITLRCPTRGCEGNPDTWFYPPEARPAARAKSRRVEFSFLDPA